MRVWNGTRVPRKRGIPFIKPGSVAMMGSAILQK
jgi:hypothetical protein